MGASCEIPLITAVVSLKYITDIMSRERYEIALYSIFSRRTYEGHVPRRRRWYDAEDGHQYLL